MTEHPYHSYQPNRSACQAKPIRLSLLSALCLTSLIGCQSLTVATAPKGVQTGAQPSITAPASHTPLQSTGNGRYEGVLSNGLKVIMQQDKRAPVVMTQVWYRVGAADEPADKGGISHLLEHMMFKGTTHVTGAEFDRLVAQYGGVNNAFTSYDFTAYYELFPANRVNLALELEADRMRHLVLDAKDFATERQVVMEERRERTDDQPLSRSYEAFRQLALPDSPKGESVIGPMSEIAGLSLADLTAWYDTWYTPNNAILVIAGDVDPVQLMPKIEHYFGTLTPKPLPPRNPLRQAMHRGYTKVTRAENIQVPTLLMSYTVPTVTTAQDSQDAYALALLQDILDGGFSARLERRLVREQGLLSSVGTSYGMFARGDAMWSIQATPRAGVSLEQAEDAIKAEITALSTAPFLPSELARAKANTLTALVYAQDDLAGRAQSIGSMQSIGLDDRLIAQLPTVLDKLTPDTLHRTAKKYLTDDNLTVMYLTPSSMNINATTATPNMNTNPHANASNSENTQNLAK